MTGQAPPPAGEGRLVVGLVRGVQGLRGMLRVEVLTDEPRRFDPGSVVYLEGSAEPLTVREMREDGPGLLVRFDEVTDRTAAEGLRGEYLEAIVAPDSLPEGAHYWHEIVGSEVLTESGEWLGAVEDVFRVGEAEVYVVNGRRGEILIPAIAAVVKQLAPADKRIVVDAEALGLSDAAAD